MADYNYAKQVERWAVFEFSCPGKTDGNPFTDYCISGVFRHKNEIVKADGFYDGDGIYKVRFMPSFEGEYCYTVSGSCMEGDIEGAFSMKAKPAIVPGLCLIRLWA